MVPDETNTPRQSAPQEGASGDSGQMQKKSHVTEPQRVSATTVVVASTVMLSFISFWRAAAIVLADLGSTAYYVGGIVEQAVG